MRKEDPASDGKERGQAITVQEEEIGGIEYSKDGVYSDITYGTPYVSKGFIFAVSLSQGKPKKPIKILVVGSGNGYELVWFAKQGHDVTGLELYAPEIPYVQERTVIGSALNMPFEDNQFDLVFCTEMFEHVTEEDSEIILREFERVGGEIFVSIATGDDPPYHTHINIHQGWWWAKKFADMGFELFNVEIKPANLLIGGGTIMRLKYSSGVTIRANCTNI